MDQANNAAQPKKHMKPFWPLMVIFVIAVLLGSLVYWYEFNLVTDYDIQSMVLSVHRRTETQKPGDSKKAATKTPATSTSTATQKTAK